MSDKVKFAIVGYGHIGKRHAAMIQGNPNAELVAVVDIDASQETHARDNYEVPFYTSIEDMLANGNQIDVVNICTPNGLHAEQALKSLEAKHHVVCEKPMGLSKASRHVFCVMQNRYSPPSAWLKSVIEKKIMGDIYMVQINCYWNRDERYYNESAWKGSLNLDGGPLFTQFSHFIDIMYWLFGDITDIAATFDKFRPELKTEFEDSGFVNFKFVDGGIGTINYSTAVYNENLESSMIILGEKGTVKVGGQYMEEVLKCDIEGYEMPELPPANPPNDYGQYKGSAANHHYIIENVIDTISEKSTATTNALEGLKIVDIIERIYALKNA